MKTLLLSSILIVLSILLTTVVLLQQGHSGMGVTFGGDGASFRTKRGLEKGLVYVTVVLSVLFFGVAILNIVLA